jgi:Cys-tRNA(Pro) deacylase
MNPGDVMDAMQRSKALEHLDLLSIPHRLTEFPTPVLTAQRVAESLGIRPAQVGKAMLFRIEDLGHGVAVVPGDRRADLRALSDLLGGKRVELVRRAEVQHVLGLPAGAVTPLAKLWKPRLQVFVDAGLMEEAVVNISTGDPQTGLSIAPGDLVQVVAGVVARIAK